MRKPLLSIFFVLSVGSFSVAQNLAPTNCPVISVTGPAGIVLTGERAKYIVTIDAIETQELDLQYVWTTSAGEIISGQGTTSIEVRQPDQGLTAMVEIKGLRAGCPNTASEHTSREGFLIPVKIGQFAGANFNGDKIDLNEIVNAMNDNPNNQLYVHFAYEKEPAPETALRRERQALDYLAATIGGRERITAIRLFGGVDLVQFWRVPPGASNPACDECDEASCPMISVIGPSGVTMPGDTAKFKVEPQLDLKPNLRFDWTVSAGTIEAGRGTSEIKVRTSEQDDLKTIHAKVFVHGLPKGCSNTADQEALVVGIHDPVLIDEFGKIPLREQYARLDTFLNELINNPLQNGYLILRYMKGTPNSAILNRVRVIKNHVFGRRRFAYNRIVIFSEPSQRVTTSIYRLPPESGDYICLGCKRH